MPNLKATGTTLIPVRAADLTWRSPMKSADPSPGASEEQPSDADGAAKKRTSHSADEEAVESLEALLKQDLAPTYEILRPLGHGPLASVYLARESALKRLVAIKVLAPDVADDRTKRLRFEREGQAIASISHPNVVSVYRVDRLSNGMPYLVMQYVKGRNLEERLQAEGPLGQDEVRRIVGQVASALAAAHRKGIVHRDVQPANILFEEETERFLLTDFGLVAILDSGETKDLRLTKTGEVVGQTTYMSPEQMMGKRVTESTDIYSLAILCYKLLTGLSQFGDDSEEQNAQSRSAPPPISELRSDVDPELELLLQRCLHKKPEDRPSAPDIARSLTTQPIDVASSPQVEETAKPKGPFAFIRKRRIPQIVGAYLAAGWFALEVTDQLDGQGIVPHLAYELILVFAVIGLPASLVLAWFHGARGPQKLHPVEIWLLSGLVFIWIVASAIVIVK